METILSFMSDLILFTAGLAVITFWVIILIIIVDEVIDLFVEARNKSIEEREDR